MVVSIAIPLKEVLDASGTFIEWIGKFRPNAEIKKGSKKLDESLKFLLEDVMTSDKSPENETLSLRFEQLTGNLKDLRDSKPSAFSRNDVRKARKVREECSEFLLDVKACSQMATLALKRGSPSPAPSTEKPSVASTPTQESFSGSRESSRPQSAASFNNCTGNVNVISINLESANMSDVAAFVKMGVEGFRAQDKNLSGTGSDETASVLSSPYYDALEEPSSELVKAV